MAKIQEVAGVIAETLRLSPEVIQSHIRGLQRAERISPHDVGAAEAADLLSACLSTDAHNPTAPYHLQFAGAAGPNGNADFILPGTPGFDLIESLAPTFGAAIERFINAMHSGTCPLDAVHSLHVTGVGARLRAIVSFTGAVDGVTGTITAFYGNQPLMELLRSIIARPGYIERGNDVGPQVLVALADLMSGMPYSHPAAVMPCEVVTVN